MYLASSAPDYEHLASWLYYVNKVDEILETDYSAEIMIQEDVQKMQASVKGMSHKEWVEDKVDTIRREKIKELREMLGFEDLDDGMKTEQAKVLDNKESLKKQYEGIREKLAQFKMQMRTEESENTDIEPDDLVNPKTGRLNIHALDKDYIQKRLNKED